MCGMFYTYLPPGRRRGAAGEPPGAYLGPYMQIYGIYRDLSWLLKSSSGEFPELVVSTETFLVTRSLYTKQASGSSGKQL